MANNDFSIIPYKGKLLKLSKLKSGKIIYKNYYIDLVTNKKCDNNWEEWLDSQNYTINTFFNYPKVVHLFYELGFLIENINLDVIIKENTILAIELDFIQVDFIKINSAKDIILNLTSAPIYSDYLKKFNEGYAQLIAGNCYQFNLTEQFNYEFDKTLKPLDFISKIWESKNSRGPFGSATYISKLNTLYLSNSPECLFQVNNEELTTMPIKGTITCIEDNEISDKWIKLQNDKKCESELFMIADLMRNDLSRIDLPCSKVVQKKAMLRVPKLLHQYSEIKVQLNSKIKMSQIMRKIFPGGSVTGAPKKSVINILRNLEGRDRGFYCGSTLLIYKELKAASINIRSSEIDFNNSVLKYSAGGGITLKSTPKEEFEEMSYKVKSYIDLLTP
jgi:anthranilate/para-aminobenzoate synthase component I